MYGIKVQVSCVAVKDNKIVLVTKLNPKLKVYQKLVPPGGHVEYGETLEQACIREMEEETGLIVSDLRMKGVVTFLREGYHSVCFIFITHEVNGELISKEPDKQICHWIELDEVQKFDEIPGYHKDLINHVVLESTFINVLVGWEDDQLTWTVRVD